MVNISTPRLIWTYRFAAVRVRSSTWWRQGASMVNSPNRFTFRRENYFLFKIFILQNYWDSIEQRTKSYHKQLIITNLRCNEEAMLACEKAFSQSLPITKYQYYPRLRAKRSHVFISQERVFHGQKICRIFHSSMKSILNTHSLCMLSSKMLRRAARICVQLQVR